jgi:hypothetical protein
MVPLSEAPNGLLRWAARPGRSFLLEAGGAEAGRLGFSGKGGSLARGETAHGEWTFKREGFLHPRITIRTTGSEQNCGSFTLAANGNGKLTLSWGEEFTFTTSGWLNSHWAFHRGPFEIVRFSRDGSSADVEIVKSGVEPETLSILIILGWYAPLLAANEEAVMATSVALRTAIS